MREIKAPEPIDNFNKTVFLAGSIELGTASNWQKEAKKLLAQSDWTILNPRRDAWDSSWKQSKDNPRFREQVEWELNAQEHATKIVMYYDPATKSPISLLELGLFAKSGKLVVVCAHGFWRKGNVDIVCEKYGVRQFETLGGAVQDILAN